MPVQRIDSNDTGSNGARSSITATHESPSGELTPGTIGATSSGSRRSSIADRARWNGSGRSGSPNTVQIRTNQPPGRRSSNAFGIATSGSTQWKAVADSTTSKAPAGRSASSNDERTMSIARPDVRSARRSAIRAPSSTAVTRQPRSSSGAVA